MGYVTSGIIRGFIGRLPVISSSLPIKSPVVNYHGPVAFLKGIQYCSILETKKGFLGRPYIFGLFN
jgi:hypothetical protein